MIHIASTIITVEIDQTHTEQIILSLRQFIFLSSLADLDLGFHPLQLVAAKSPKFIISTRVSFIEEEDGDEEEEQRFPAPGSTEPNPHQAPPVKSLLRFKCVCKQWRSMIESPEFISEHATTYRDNVTEKFLLDHSSERKCLVHERETLRRTVEVVLWSPSIRKHIIFPSGEDSVNRFWKSEFSQMMFTLGYDGLRHDYKVFVIIFYCDKYYVDGGGGGGGVRNDDLGDGVDEDWSDDVVGDWEKKGPKDLPSVLPSTVPVVVGVYSLNENSWKTIAHSTRLIRLGGYSERVFLKGAINFIGNITKKSVKGKLKERIIAFDVRTEVYRYFMVPKDDTEFCATRKLGALGESLVILDHVRFLSEYCCLWVMENTGVSHSWTRQYTIGVEDVNPFFVLRFSKIGEIVLRIRMVE
ncbi:hypothetical protein AKJ16_DCAP09416 [Drosera capensis]